ncbi:hypothetical protein QNH14_01165 [Apirhabdus apintestini]|nr:hypothetical protein QNH14_01165 [Enterobacteriaceae bacterium CA-0114]
MLTLHVHWFCKNPGGKGIWYPLAINPVITVLPPLLAQIPDWHWSKRANPVSGLVVEKSIIRDVVGTHLPSQWIILLGEEAAVRFTTNPFNAQQITL